MSNQTPDNPVSTDNVCDVPGPRIDPDIPDLVSQTEAGRILGNEDGPMSKQRVDVLRNEGRLPGKQVEGSGAWVYRRKLVEELKPKLGKRPPVE